MKKLLLVLGLGLTLTTQAQLKTQLEKNNKEQVALELIKAGNIGNEAIKSPFYGLLVSAIASSFTYSLLSSDNMNMTKQDAILGTTAVFVGTTLAFDIRTISLKVRKNKHLIKAGQLMLKEIK